MMKKAIAWVGSWVCFWMGHFWSKPLEWDFPKEEDNQGKKWVEWYYGFWYVPYNRLMGWSLRIQDWAELDERGPWHKPESLNGETEEGLED